MSRFFAKGLSDSDSSSSESDEELYSEEEEDENEIASDKSEESSSSDDDDDSDAEGEAPAENRASRFMRGLSGADDGDSSDDESKRVVRSAKDKRFDEIDGCIKLIENAEKINDWAVISTEFDKLNRLITKANTGSKFPKAYIKAVADLEDFMNETITKEKTASKKMNATNARALNSIKQRLKRNNRLYETDIEAYRADKEGFMQEDAVEDDVVVSSAPSSRKVASAANDEDEEGFSTVGRGGRTLQFTPESIKKHLRLIIGARGKKNTDRLEQIRTIEKLYEVAITPWQKITALLALVSTRFDLSTGILSYMALDQWKSAESELNALLEVLENNKEYIVSESGEEWEHEDREPAPAAGETFKIPGSVVSFADRLDDELTRSLQHIDPHTTEYIDRLGDEEALYRTVIRCQIYFERLSTVETTPDVGANLNRVIMRRLEHVYFKPSSVIETIELKSWEKLPSSVDSKITSRSQSDKDVKAIVQTLCSYLYKHDSTMIRTRAMLCHIYHLALHNNFFQSRDMLLMSHLQENIHNADISTQILYNRTLVQVGLCAFRAGLISESQSCLQEICGTGRMKELLAQGVQMQRYSQVSAEQERLEKQRQLPFHMHINLELLECAYLSCSMLLEIPAMAASGSSPDLRRRVISKTFRRMLEYHERQMFTGPPENTRDHVMQAAKALAAGEWKKSSELVQMIKIWDLLPNPEATKIMLGEKIQEEGLRTYIFTYAPFYDTLAVSKLSTMFDLPERKVSALISKMIAHDEIAAALDQVNDAIVFRKGAEVSRLQSLALALSDKASSLIELNERVFEQKSQTSGASGGGAFQESAGARNTTGARGNRGRGDGSTTRGGGRGGQGGRGRGNRNVQFANDRYAVKA